MTAWPRKVGLARELSALGAAVEFVSEGRYVAVALDDPRCDVRVVPPQDPSFVVDLLADHPSPVLVFETNGAAHAHAVAVLLGTGIANYVHGPTIKVLVAHLDAIVRRSEILGTSSLARPAPVAQSDRATAS